jgi:predicted DNA-binding transcriptional regulator YafY
MPIVKNAQERLYILDEILGGIRKYDLRNLLEKVNEKLLLSGFSTISEKTLFNDLKFLKEDKEAPINKPTKVNPFYYYTEKFSIKNLLLEEEEVDSLKQASEILKRLSPYLIGSEIDEIISKLEQRVHTNVPSRDQIIQFETHTQSAGANWIQNLFSAIKDKCSLRLSYKPFHKTEAREFIFHPYLLKQYRNRWFLFGRENENPYILNLALDRIQSIKNSSATFVENNLFQPDEHFKHLVGVSMPRESKIHDIIIKVDATSVPYLMSKPIHNLQETIKTYKNGDIQIKLPVYINYELISTILSYGTALEVIKPAVLREEIANNINIISKKYG